MELVPLLERVVAAGASDVHLKLGQPPVVRLDGDLEPMGDEPVLTEYDLESVLDEITDALAAGNRVELRGFGAFSVKNRPSRSGRNPRTGDTVFVEEKWVPFFKTGKELRERLNPGQADEED